MSVLEDFYNSIEELRSKVKLTISGKKDNNKESVRDQVIELKKQISRLKNVGDAYRIKSAISSAISLASQFSGNSKLISELHKLLSDIDEKEQILSNEEKKSSLRNNTELEQQNKKMILMMHNKSCL
ncbi:MAG: hypothetical protein AB8B67_04245 [Rickettsiaceae bacterium]